MSRGSWHLSRTLDLLLPPTQKAGRSAAAEAEWRADRPGEYCMRCGASAAAESLTIHGCAHCRDRRVAWDGVWRLGAYQTPLSEWILQYKFRGGWAWGRWFGAQLASITPPRRDALVVPVPLHWSRRLLRGYDQAAMLARRFAAEQRLPFAHGLLRRRRRTRKQTELTSEAGRAQNVRRAFQVRPVDLTGWSVWLVDDVKTTGATAAACARLLRRAGAERVMLAVIAVADPKGADFQRR